MATDRRPIGGAGEVHATNLAQTRSSFPTICRVPVDDGAARHLTGLALPDVALIATTTAPGEPVATSRAHGRLHLSPHRPSGPGDADRLERNPGARGCTPRAAPSATISTNCVRSACATSTASRPRTATISARRGTAASAVCDSVGRRLFPAARVAAADVRSGRNGAAQALWRSSSTTGRSPRCSIQCFRPTAAPRRWWLGCVRRQGDQ